METYSVINISDENNIKYDGKIMQILLKDRTTKKNIIWATNDYLQFGNMYKYDMEIKIKSIQNNDVIQSRICKSVEKQNKRTKRKAEVFTPSWICNKQNNIIDEQWFGKKNVFNKELINSWETNLEKIKFSKEKKLSWKKYVDARRMEISCGEAPYLVSRYDVVTGNKIPLALRIGLLDRKMRIVNENTSDEEEWFKWTQRAFQSIYGYEFQGDNLFLARKNLLDTFVENMIYKFNKKPSLEQLKIISTIISWNIWQMDGITFSSPCINIQLNIFTYLNNSENTNQYCKIKNWRSKKIIEYISLLRGK